MAHGIVARVSAVLVLAAFAAGCSAEGESIRRPREAASESDDTARDRESTLKPADPAATTAAPAQPAAPTTPAPPAKPAISCLTDSDSVTASYWIALLRKPDEGGLATWLGEIQNGETRLGVLRRIIQSEEFTTGKANLTNEEFVVQLYRSFFDRVADEAGMAGWVAQLTNGGSRTAVALAFADSEEFKDPKTNPAVGCYF